MARWRDGEMVDGSGDGRWEMMEMKNGIYQSTIFVYRYHPPSTLLPDYIQPGLAEVSDFPMFHWFVVATLKECDIRWKHVERTNSECHSNAGPLLAVLVTRTLSLNLRSVVALPS